MKRVWGTDYWEAYNTLQVHICKLKRPKKISDTHVR